MRTATWKTRNSVGWKTVYSLMRKNLLAVILCSTVFVINAYSQHFRDKFQDGRNVDYTIHTSDARQLPKVFIGFRGVANPFLLIDNSGKLLVKLDMAYTQIALYSRVGGEAIIPFIRKHPTGKSNSIELGTAPAPNQWMHHDYYMRITNLVKTSSFGFHAGYNYKVFRGEANVRLARNNTIYRLNNLAGHEFAIGIGYYSRRGLAVESHSVDNGTPVPFQFRSLLLSYSADILINTGYTYDVKIYGEPIPWDAKLMTFPQVGGQLAFDFYWNPGWSKKSRSVSIGFSGRFCIQKGFIAGLNASTVVPEIMGGVYLNVLSKSKWRQSELMPTIEIWYRERTPTITVYQ